MVSPSVVHNTPQPNGNSHGSEKTHVYRSSEQPTPAEPEQFELVDSEALASKLGVPESWVRSRSNPKRTRDPIPHYKLGRYVRFKWGSEPLRAWLDRQLVSANRAGH